MGYYPFSYWFNSLFSYLMNYVETFFNEKYLNVNLTQMCLFTTPQLLQTNSKIQIAAFIYELCVSS